MIYSITGIYKGFIGDYLYLENNSIVWEIVMPSNSTAMPREGDNITVYTYLYHKEDMMQLYGFWDVKSRNLFLQLLKVQGIGPKQAIKILSATTVDTFISIINENDISKLSLLPGIGKKTAQKILLVLKDILVYPHDDSQHLDSIYNDIIVALSDMGFEKEKIRKILPDIEKTLPPEMDRMEKEQELLRLAIIALSK
ncbi:Holliday junction branch migration protein RuvA [Spirochaetia bacterium 38H-sp]|uniref:Holliday junction branch migration complex subunit RuvA n=1 Tax=Rarispira pelagica TaxID=3141764 RepID=A0ABU9UAU5_9SPIR